MDVVLSAACERARGWASLALDCELSELERAHLRSHLDQCEACTTFLDGLREVTQELRTAPLPAPSRPLAPRRPRGSRVPVVLAVLAIAGAAAAGGLAGSLRQSPRHATVTATGPRLAALFPTALPKSPGARLPSRAAV
jgi:ferric-dicitrate binding protein FerR (iron transport regulator)